MYKVILQIAIALSLFLVSSYIAWYEGSTLTHISWEWKHSTPFSNFFNVEITEGKDILYLEYFVYAAKYHPFFPILMFISLVYILSILGIYFLKKKGNWVMVYWVTVGIILLIFSGFISIPSTTGGWILFGISAFCGIIYLGVAVNYYLHNIKFLMRWIMLFLLLNNKNREVRSISKLMYTDVSNDPWDIANLTKYILDYSVESISIIDLYLEKLKDSDFGEKNAIRLSSRIGAYIGEVFRRNLSYKHNWYELILLEDEIKEIEKYYDIIYQQEILYSKKQETYILPQYEAYIYLINKSNYKSMTSFVSEVLKFHGK